jgi:DNA repair protein RadD
MLRPYQQLAHDAIINWICKITKPCMIEAATGAGKSHIIAALAETVLGMSNKKVLCLAPSKELVEQNHAKYPGRASFFSASVGKKSIEHSVIFGTPMTVLNSIELFGNEIAMVIIDECHGITPTIKKIISNIPNPNLRIVGMSATPYRMNTGYIYAQRADGGAITPAVEPYFTRCVYRITAQELIKQGYLTPPVLGEIGVRSYETKQMKLDRKGQFSKEDIDRAYHGQGRKTSNIVDDIVEQSKDRRGVLIFAATVRHAREVMDSLPSEISAIVTGETHKTERERILEAFKAQEVKYIVNVAVLTTGFDATHVDVIAMMRATESVGLMQQIIGRGLRLHDGKKDCLVLDYAENTDRHCPDGDIFDPNIKAKDESGEKRVDCICPDCNALNSFKARPNPTRFEINEAGYFCDLDGSVIEGEYGDIPAHFGRRCTAEHVYAGELRRCAYRWTSKKCPHCEELNDIAARYCMECKGELVDPNEKLRISYKEKKSDPYQKQCDEVLKFIVRPTISRAGRDQWSIFVITPYRRFTFWVSRTPKWSSEVASHNMFAMLRGSTPQTITYQKQGEFYKVFAYNEAKDEAPN